MQGDLADLSTKPTTMTRWYLIGAAFLIAVVIGVGIGLYRAHQAQVRSDQIAVAQRTYDRFANAKRSIQETFDASDRVYAAAMKDADRAYTVSMHRHDDAVSGSPDTSAEYSWAKQELDADKSLAANITRLDEGHLKTLNVFEQVYGGDAVADARAKDGAWLAVAQEWVSANERAAGDVRDQLEMSLNGQDVSDDPSIEENYRDGDRLISEQRKALSAYVAAREALSRRLDRDIAKAKSALDAAKKT